MITAHKIEISPQVYLEQERNRIREKEGKYEFINYTLVDMSGASTKHNLICSNLHILIGNIIWNKENVFICQADQRIYNPFSNTYLYPDIVVIQGEPQYVDNVFDTITNPLLIIEVLSDSIENYDRGIKFMNYLNIPNFREYVLIAQDKYEVDTFYRNDEGLWKINSFTKPEMEVELFSLNCKIAFITVHFLILESMLFLLTSDSVVHLYKYFE
jgi:Uma2 family endonuclease